MVLAASGDSGFFGACTTSSGRARGRSSATSSIFLVVVFWLAVGYWVYKDARRRIEDPWLVGDGDGARARSAVRRRAHLHALPAARVPRGRARARARDQGDGGEPRPRRQQHCPVCRAEIDENFLVCPVCTTRLRQACATCKAPLEPLWQVCPYCETPIATPTADPVPAARASAERDRVRVASGRRGRRAHPRPDQARRGAPRRSPARSSRASSGAGSSCARRKLVQVDRELAEEHYAEHAEKPFFGELVEFITSGPTLALVLEGEGAIASSGRRWARRTRPTPRPARSAATSLSRCRTTSSTARTRRSRPQREIALWFD